MIECEWKSLTVGSPCIRCGYELRRTYEETPSRRCDIAGNSKAKQVWNYAKAVAKWKLAGRPTRSDQEIASVFAICQACPNFTDDKRPHCKLCGCSLSRSPDGLVNKIAMATENCPDKPPRW